MIVKVYLPAPNTYLARTAAFGSGIVGNPQPDEDRVMVYIEGNEYGAENIKTFEDKLYHAAGRLIERYPTLAKAFVSKTDLIIVGGFNTETKVFTPEGVTELTSQMLHHWVAGG